MFPGANVIGVDISPIQPNLVPTNLCFQVDDVEMEWNYRFGLDFINARGLSGSIKDVRKFLAQAHESLNVQGWLELSDIVLDTVSDNDMLKPGSKIKEWESHMKDASSRNGRPIDSPTFYEERMIAAGFCNVTVKTYELPLNEWPTDEAKKELGRYCLEIFANNLFAWSADLFIRILGWTREKLTVYLAEVRDAMKDEEVRPKLKLQVVYGQKLGPKL
ncbi:hypothetical protein K4F52_010142 [Lecanicillium sp. MT-2017a]|nr:hypothetical protein K4F52_010142 [Lecanicillium sp. MT-2017a]